jgi:endo-1,4-beta-xylanase
LLEDRSHRMGVGTAVGSLFNRTDAAGAQYMTILAREFNVLTAENDMKFGPLRPSRDVFRFARPDSMVAFAKANNMKLRGHTLVWHNQLASWLTNGNWTRDQAIALLEEHITTVVGHYRGQFAAWDVVNESFNDGDGSLRSSFWSDRIGREYIERSFRAARAADATTPLFYNDYNIEHVGPKSDSVYAMLSDFKARGVPVDGVGFQMHFIVGALPSLSSIQQNAARFAALGLKIHITELDIRMPVPSTAQSLQTQAQNYRDVFNFCMQTPACEMLVMWGFTDRDSWIPGTFPGQGDALLFDGAFQPKPAYTAVRNLLAGT